jgi:predicted unusual protein kinase regulating ubiquinone biosynthesis (AarF/ABC1/UbiB family)
LYITLDLYIINNILEFLSNFERIREEAKSVVALIDVWASRFLDELDYGKELQNSLLFKEQMNNSSITNSLLNDAIVVPKVFKEISSKNVLVSEWIIGDTLTHILTLTYSLTDSLTY